MAGNKNSGRQLALTEQRVEIIKTASRNGHSNKVIGQMLGFNEKQWRRVLDKHPEVSDMMDVERATAKDYLLDKLQPILEDPSHPHYQKTIAWMIQRLDKIDNLKEKISNIERMTALKIEAQKALVAEVEKNRDVVAIGFEINPLKPAIRDENDRILNLEDYTGLLTLQDDE